MIKNPKHLATSKEGRKEGRRAEVHLEDLVCLFKELSSLPRFNVDHFVLDRIERGFYGR